MMANPKPWVWAASGVRPILTDRLDDIAAHAPRHDADGSFPSEAIGLLHDAGLLTASVLTDHGGAGLRIADLVTIASSIGRGDPSAALIMLMNLQFHAGQGRGAPRAVAPHLYAAILSESLERPTLLNPLRAEPDLGAPARGGLPATRARFSRDGWVISGRKMFCTGSTGLSYHLPWAVTDEATPRVAEFLVPAASPGIRIVKTWDHLGLRATQSHDIIYDDVLVPHDHIVNPEVVTAKTKQDARSVAPVVLLIQSIYVGVAKAAQEAFADFAHHRVPANLGRPIATTEHIRTAAGRIELSILQAETLLRYYAERMDAGDETAFSTVTAAKTLISASLISAVDTAVKALGNPGLSRNNPLERHFRDVLCSRIHSPQEDSVLNTIGAESLGRHAPTPGI